ncbi:protein kinase [Lentinula raphanica]|nr:protein kinase [Lentinula raphanica]
MEPIPEDHPSQITQTPPKKSTHGPKVVDSTPQSKRAATHARDEVPQVIEEVNKFLEDDVSDKVVLTLDEFATIILGLDPKCGIEENFTLNPESEAVKDAFQDYLRLAIGEADGVGKRRKGRAKDEKELYQPLVNLLNIFSCAEEDIDERIFYVQDPRPVLGSLLERKPDLGVIYAQLLDLAENESLSERLAETDIKGVFWGILLFFVEVKHKKGNFIGRSKACQNNTGFEQDSSGSTDTTFSELTQSRTVSSKTRSTKRKRGNDASPLTDANIPSRASKKAKSQSTTQSKGGSRRGPGAVHATSANQVPSGGSRMLTRSAAKAKEATNSQTSNSRSNKSPSVPAAGEGSKRKVELTEEQRYKQVKAEEVKAEAKLTATQGQRRTRIQCASYAKEMLSHGFIRNHAIGIVADDNVVRFQYYDHSKVVESTALNISDDEWKKLFMAMVCQLSKLDHEKLGFVPRLHLDTFDHFRNSEQLARDLKNDPEGLVGATYTFTDPTDPTDPKRSITVTIVKVLYRAEGIIGRSSIVAEVRCVCSANRCPKSGCQWHGENKIMKISFPSSDRVPEPDLISEATENARSTNNDWALNHLPNIIRSITIEYHPVDSAQGRLKAHLKEDYEERVMRVTFYEKLQPLSELEDLRELAQVLYDILQIHQWLYECVNILHRDLSIGNLMFRRKEGKVYGVLNDFDLSSTVARMAQGPSSKERTGTRPFMSPDLLNSLWKGGHFPRHDLESLFFIILCLVCRYDELYGLRPCAEPRPFTKWFVGSDADVYAYKVSFIFDSPDPPIQPYFTTFEPWVTALRDCLADGYEHRPKIRASNVAQPRAVDYDWETLGGTVTYHKFRLVMSAFRGVPLETRWPGSKPQTGSSP